MQASALTLDIEEARFSNLRYVSLRLLWDCNLRCIMCDHPHLPRNEMAVETAHSVLDQLTHPVRLTFIGGEPCLWLLRHPEVLRRAMDEGHVVHIISNGILIPRLTDFVTAFRTRAVSIQFSIDGFEQTYERIRQRSSWALLLESIRLLHRMRQEGGNSRAFITTNYLLMRSTLEDLPRFIHFCADEGIDAVSLTYALIYHSMVKRGAIVESESVYFHREATQAALEEACSVAVARNISLCLPPPLDEPAAFGKRWVGKEKASMAPGKSLMPPSDRIACDKPWKEIFVNQDGTLVPCCCGPQRGPVVGNLNAGLTHLWNGEQVKSVRRALAQGEFPSDCRCGINISAVGRKETPDRYFTSIPSELP